MFDYQLVKNFLLNRLNLPYSEVANVLNAAKNYYPLLAHANENVKIVAVLNSILTDIGCYRDETLFEEFLNDEESLINASTQLSSSTFEEMKPASYWISPYLLNQPDFVFEEALAVLSTESLSPRQIAISVRQIVSEVEIKDDSSLKVLFDLSVRQALQFEENLEEFQELTNLFLTKAFQVTKIIGSGCDGVVAEISLYDKPYALKLWHASAKTAFHEIRAHAVASTLSHPNIIPMLACFRIKTQYGMIMPLTETSLKHLYIQDDSPLHFQVIHSIYALQKAFLFNHNDVHAGNILAVSVPIATNTYIVNGITYVVPNKGYQLYLTDFSRSRFEYNNQRCFFDEDDEASQLVSSSETVPYEHQYWPRADIDTYFFGELYGQPDTAIERLYSKYAIKQ